MVSTLVSGYGLQHLSLEHRHEEGRVINWLTYWRQVDGFDASTLQPQVGRHVGQKVRNNSHQNI